MSLLLRGGDGLQLVSCLSFGWREQTSSRSFRHSARRGPFWFTPLAPSGLVALGGRLTQEAPSDPMGLSPRAVGGPVAHPAGVLPLAADAHELLPLRGH